MEKKNKLGPGVYDPEKMGSTIKGFKMKDNMYDRFGNLKSIYSMAKTINVEGAMEKYESNIGKIADSKKGFTSMFKSNTKRS